MCCQRPEPHKGIEGHPLRQPEAVKASPLCVLDQGHEFGVGERRRGASVSGPSRLGGFGDYRYAESRHMGTSIYGQSPTVMSMFPQGSRTAEQSGGTTTVVSYSSIIIGPVTGPTPARSDLERIGVST